MYHFYIRYLIDIRWFKQLKRYLGLDPKSEEQSIQGDPSANPGPIDNSGLLDDSGQLQPHLIDEFSYSLLPDEAWELLVKHFGVTPGQEPISRKVFKLLNLG